MDRRSLLAGFFAGVGSGALAAPPLVSTRPVHRPGRISAQANAHGVRSIIASSGLSGRIACSLADVETGMVLHSTLPDLPLPPASVAKALTALYALDNLGPAHRFRTLLIAAGSLSSGRLDGDLVLMGSGDPTLDTDALASLAAQAREAGLRTVTGRLLIWAGALPALNEIDAAQPAHVGYNPAISGMNLNFNRVYFEWKPQAGQYDISLDARTEQFRPAVDVIRMQISNRESPIYTHKIKNDGEEWTVARGALGRGGGRWLPVRQPALYAGDVMQELLAANGIRVSRVSAVRNPPRGQTIAGHQSEPLPNIVRGMLKYSNNLTAEALGLTTSRLSNTDIMSLKASARQMNDWTAATTRAGQPKLRDHSGLDGRSELTVSDMVQMLISPRTRQSLRPLFKEIRLSEAARSAGAPENLKITAKTGSLNFVSTLAGYLDAPGRRPLAFAIFCADVPRRNRLSRTERERPAGGRRWQQRARALQMELIAHWSRPHG